MTKMLIGVAYDEERDSYIVDLGKGSSVPETAFGISVIVKCLIRDKIIEDKKDLLDLVNKYLDDPLYNELKENSDGGNNVQ